MRKSIRNRIMAQVKDFKKSVFEPHMASATQAKPYAVVVMGDETDTNIRDGFDLNVHVWIYIDRTTFVSLDTLKDEVVLALHKIDLATASGNKFRLRYLGSSSDVYDPEWRALTKRLDFVTESVHA